MKTTIGLAVLAAMSILAGCASTDQNAGSATAASPQADATAVAAKDDDYVTGSRLPRKGSGEQPTKSMSKQDWRLETNRGIGNAPPGS